MRNPRLSRAGDTAEPRSARSGGGAVSAPDPLRLPPTPPAYAVYVAEDELPRCCFLRELEELHLPGTGAGGCGKGDISDTKT